MEKFPQPRHLGVGGFFIDQKIKVLPRHRGKNGQIPTADCQLRPGPGMESNSVKKNQWSGTIREYRYLYIYIYMGSGRFPGPMELLLQQLVRVSKTRWRWFNLSKSMLLQPLIKKLEVLVMINQWTTYCINDNNDERWMVVLIDFYLTFCKN